MLSEPRPPFDRRRGPAATALLAIVALLAGCSSPGPTASPPTTAASPPAPAPTAASGGAEALDGSWIGALEDPNGTYPVRVAFAGCEAVGDPCGELEYEDPGAPGTVLCASELTFTGLKGEAFEFAERLTYHPGLCLPTSFRVTASGPDALRLDQVIEGAVCCTASLARDAAAPAATPGLPVVAGLGQTTSRLALSGTTTQYVAIADGAAWFPVDDAGAVVRLDAATGALVATIETGSPRSFDGPPSDPHAVVAGDAGTWVAQAGSKAVGRIDPASNTVVETIPIGVVPYALALDGATLWIASFEDDTVVSVDTGSKEVGGRISVTKPTGIAAGLGAVWVVGHRDDALVRIDPTSGRIAATISLGPRGPSGVCGMCVENVVVAEGAVWTANNHGRSVSRIDPDGNEVTTIAVPLRVWSVAVAGGAIWAGQFDATPDDRWTAEDTWGVARIAPDTNEATVFGYPGAFGVVGGGDALWLIVPGRRGDEVARVTLAP